MAEEQPKYDGPERRAQPSIWTPQFIWQIITFSLLQLIAGFSLYLGVSTRLTIIEVKMEERSKIIDRQLDRERDERTADYKELRAWIGSTDKAVSDLKAQVAYETKGK